jgi:predicted nucleotidyltransferase
MRHQASIKKLSRVLREHFSDSIDRILVFGSVARGRDTRASDIDVVVVLDMASDSVGWRVERQVRALIYPIELEDDVIFDLKVVAKGDLSGLRGHTPFMETVTAQGVSV